MIKIVAQMNVKKECIDDFVKMAKELEAKSREEEGNVSYTLNKKVGSENVFAFLEVWKDNAAVEFHNATEHFTTYFPKLQEMCSEEGEVALFEEVA